MFCVHFVTKTHIFIISIKLRIFYTHHDIFQENIFSLTLKVRISKTTCTVDSTSKGLFNLSKFVSIFTASFVQYLYSVHRKQQIFVVVAVRLLTMFFL